MSDEDFEGLDETLAILSDSQLMARLREGEAAVAAGDVVALEGVAVALGTDEPE